MQKISDFYEPLASSQLFTTHFPGGTSIHDQLKERGYTIIDRPTLESSYQDLHAPVATVDLSYAKSIPTPTSGYKTAFFVGHAYETKAAKFKNRALADVISEWLDTTLDGDKFIMSLVPETYLLAKSESIVFEDIFKISNGWGIDCIIGVFDKAGNSMFVFAEEFALTHISIATSQLPAEFDEVSGLFDSVETKGVVRELQGRIGGDVERVKEYYEKVVKPFL